MSEKKNPVYRIFLVVVSSLLKLICALEVEGGSELKSGGAVIFVANHVTAIDPFVVAAALSKRSLNSLAKEELFKSPILAAFLRKIGVISVSRSRYDREAIKMALEILKEGRALALFPEGTRYRLGKGELGPLHDGAAMISLLSGAPIIPLAITGTDKVLPKGAKFIRPAKVKVKIGTEIGRSNDRKEYTEKIRAAMLKLLKEVQGEG